VALEKEKKALARELRKSDKRQKEMEKILKENFQVLDNVVHQEKLIASLQEEIASYKVNAAKASSHTEDLCLENIGKLRSRIQGLKSQTLPPARPPLKASENLLS